MLCRFKHFFFEGFLLENRLDFIKSKNPTIDSSHDSLAQHRDAGAIVDHFAEKADPSSDKKYTQWIINQYKRKHIRQEDHPRVKEALSNFEKHKGKLESKDINGYSHISYLENALTPHLGSAGSKKEEKRLIKHEGADLIHDGPNLTVHHLKTEKAACLYGANTKWCTAARNGNMFDEYNRQGPIYAIQNKHTGEKHQFHFETDQFMDAKDHPINLPKFIANNPELKEVPQFRNSSHGALFARTPEERKKAVDDLIEKERSPSKRNRDHIDIVNHVLRNVPLDKDQADKMAHHPQSYMRSILMNTPYATAEHVHKLAYDPDMGTEVLARPELGSEHIDKILPSLTNIHTIGNTGYSKTGKLTQNPNLQSRHIDHIVKYGHPRHKALAAIHPNANPAHMGTLLKSVDHETRSNAANVLVHRANTTHTQIPPDIVDRLVHDRHEDVKNEIAEYRDLPQHHVDKLADDLLHKDESVYNILQHPKLSPRHVDAAVGHSEPSIREYISMTRALKKHHIDELVHDENYDVRQVVAQRPDLTARHRAALRSHDDEY